MLGAACLLLAACGPLGRRGTLTARWIAGPDTASLTVPASASWCAGPGRLDIRAFSGDTGLGLVVYPTDSTALAGDFPVLEPGAQIQVRPSAGVALRWMGKVDIEGRWGNSGSVRVSGELGRALSGGGNVWLISNLGPDSVTSLEFSFRGLHAKTDTPCDAPVLPVGVPVDSAAAAGTPSAPGID
jgi:hypothetical protein